MTKRFCPCCDQEIDMVDNGHGPGTNEYNDPIVFADHLRDDRRGPDLTVRTPCPGSGKNMALARKSY